MSMIGKLITSIDVMKILDTGLPQGSDLRLILAIINNGCWNPQGQAIGAELPEDERMRERFGDPLFVRAGN